eukprot:TRINITY_DN36836_c0_g1_i1.p1 TRINITY_DN36836_c0_g1~~TRINITY_DN36836_c0_g1_i1.p1  ORF type:complete len:1137 (+),score=220.63 TRINITY_DN36836_c0_g1_i1:150-3560(+)
MAANGAPTEVAVNVADDGFTRFTTTDAEAEKHLADIASHLAPLHRDQLKASAQNYLLETACTTYDDATHKFKFRPCCKTTARDLGELGVGVRLYFVFLKQIGIVFFICSILTSVNLYFNLVGGMVHDNNVLYKFLGRLTVASLGNCEGGYCEDDQDLQNRCLEDSFPCADDNKLSDWTMVIGLCDGLAVLLILFWGLWFSNRTIPKVVKQVDEDTLSATDFSIMIPDPPRELPFDHENYEAKLREHFAEVLRGMKDPELTQDPVVEVTLVREYDGAISQFMEKGDMLNTQCSHLIKERELRAKGTPKALKTADSHHKKALKEYKKMTKLEDNLKHQADMTDEQRKVVMAFVTFKTEAIKHKVLNEYRFSTYSIFRCCQDKKLRFAGRPLKVVEACEPSDLFWENLDYTWWKRDLRKAFVVILTLLMLIVCSGVLVYFQSLSKKAGASNNQQLVWILKTTPESDIGCMKLCDFELFGDTHCAPTGDTSDTWPSAKTFDVNKDYSINSAGSYFKTSLPNCATQWNSPTCSSGNKNHDWIGIEFKTPRQANCMKVKLEKMSIAKSLRLFGCQTVPPAAGTARQNWKVEDHCSPMSAMRITRPDAKGLLAIVKNDFAAPLKQVVPDTSCETPVSLEVGRQKFKALEKEDQASDPVMKCFCDQKVKEFGPAFRVPPYETEEEKICEEYSMQENFKLGRLAGGTLGVLVINQIILFVYEYLVQWERHGNFTDAALSQLWKLFLALFINTGLLVLLVNASLKDVPDWFAPFRVLSIGTGEYDDFNVAWYVSVGSTLCVTISAQVFSTTVPQLAKAFILKPILNWAFSRSVVVQDQLNVIYKLPEWNLALRMAQTLTVTIVITMYSGGMPALYIVGFIYAFIAFHLDKWCLLHGSQRPPTYNASIIKVCMHIFPVAAFLHCCIACWTYGNQKLFPSDWSELLPLGELAFGITKKEYYEIMDKYMSSSAEVKETMQSDYFRARMLDFAREGCWLLLCIFLVFCAYYIVYWVLTLFLYPFVAPLLFALRDMISRSCCRRCAGVEKHAAGTFEQCKEECAKQKRLASYKLEHNPKYKAAYLAIHHTSKVVSARKKEKEDDADVIKLEFVDESAAPVPDAPAPVIVATVDPIMLPEGEDHSEGEIAEL